MSKRIFDIFFSVIGLAILLPLFLIAAIFTKLSSPGPILFRQDRVGKNGRIFKIIKFRTMVENASCHQGNICVFNDPRITKYGSFLRRLRIDELPQLINVLKGDMSLVGPRPELKKFVDHFPEIYDKILTVRPGITGLASIKFRDEASFLKGKEDTDDCYIREILPQKLKYNLEYVETHNLPYDLALVLRTILVMLFK